MGWMMPATFYNGMSLLQKYFRSWFDTSPGTENQLVKDHWLQTTASVRPAHVIKACPKLVEGSEKGLLQ
jgi:hypothetical protein